MTLSFGKIYGKIIYFSENLPHMMGYSKTEFSYKSRVNEILPKIISDVIN